MMATRQEMFVFGCRSDDIDTLTRSVARLGPALHVTDDPGEFVRCAISGRALAVLLGIGRQTLSNLDMIPLIHTVREELPAILVAEDASLELERRARQHKIFYYLVHPIGRSEVEAVVADLLRSRK